MDLLVSEAQQPLVDAIADFLQHEYPLARFNAPAVHTRIGGGDVADLKRWQAMAELGWFGLGLATEWDGVGCDLGEEMLLCCALGRHLVTPAVLASMLSARLYAACGRPDEVRAIVSGATRPALAIPLGPVCLDERVSGNFHIIDGERSDLLLTWNAGQAVLLERNALDGGEAVACLDESIHLERVRARDIAPLVAVSAEREPIRLHATVLVAALLAGVAEAVRDMAVDYTKVREQFGQPIGAFQAIKHCCADMAVRTEAAMAQTRFAAVMARDGAAGSQAHASAALLLAGRAALDNATANIQVHGAMGYTTECHAHRFLKRAHLLMAIGGSARQHQQILLGAVPSAGEGAR